MTSPDQQTSTTIGIVGAGAMGRGIAQVTVTGGMTALIYDAAEGAAAKAQEFVGGMIDRLVEKNRLEADAATEAKSGLQIVDSLEGLADCDLVIEAIVENIEIKQQVFKSLEAVLSDDAIIASNTSSIRIASIASACEKRDRIAGMHFFNPVPLMRLVEIIRAPETSDATAETLSDIGKRMGRTPVAAQDGPGFLVNLGGRAYTTEGLRIATECVASPAQIDAVMRDCCGFRMGPFELMDLTGIDVNFPVSKIVFLTGISMISASRRHRCTRRFMPPGVMAAKPTPVFLTTLKTARNPVAAPRLIMSRTSNRRPASSWPRTTRNSLS